MAEDSNMQIMQQGNKGISLLNWHERTNRALLSWHCRQFEANFYFQNDIVTTFKRHT